MTFVAGGGTRQRSLIFRHGALKRVGFGEGPKPPPPKIVEFLSLGMAISQCISDAKCMQQEDAEKICLVF